NSGGPAISADGRYVAFASVATNLVPNGSHPLNDVFVHDRVTGETTRVSVASDGTPGNADFGSVSISADGRFVAFESNAGNLVPGDSGYPDIFVHDRVTGQTTRESVASDGTQANGDSHQTSLSADGRFVAFVSYAANLVPNDTNQAPDVFVHDRLTGGTILVSKASSGDEANGAVSQFPALSAAGRFVAFVSDATNLVSGAGGPLGLFIRGPSATSNDITGDGDVADTVLEVLDARGAGAVTPLCPAGAVTVAAGAAAFLRPENAGATPNLACPPGPSLNGDADTTDDVVHLWSGGSVQNLGRAASAVTLGAVCSVAGTACTRYDDCPAGETCAASWVAALVSESGQGQTDFNGDGDAVDSVLQVYGVNGGGWTNVGKAADTVAAAGPIVAFTSPEAAQGGTDLNGDGDALDRVLGVYHADTGALTNVGQAAAEFVLGDRGLVAFRTLEQDQGNTDLNHDGDHLDGVLQVYDAVSDRLLNSGFAVTPCELEACDPRVPYRVLKDTVRFL